MDISPNNKPKVVAKQIDMAVIFNVTAKPENKLGRLSFKSNIKSKLHQLLKTTILFFDILSHNFVIFTACFKLF